MDESRDRIFFHLMTYASLEKEGRRSAIWSMPMQKRGEFMNGVVWLGEHRSHWPKWRRIVERDGVDAMAVEINALMQHRLVEDVTNIYFAMGDDPEIRVCVTLVTRDVEVAVIRFKNDTRREEFLRWYEAQDPQIYEAYVKVACLHGPNVLQDLVNAMFVGDEAFAAAAKRAVAYR